MTKLKLPNGNYESCVKCGREITVNDCTLHIGKNDCYYCHLGEFHVGNIDDSPPEDKTKPKKNTITFADTTKDRQDKPKDKPKDTTNNDKYYGVSSNKDDDRGIYS
jgi:hypothetical protein